MLSKVANYGGFQSYSDVPYASLKPGMKQLESNTVFAETVRKDNALNFYENNNRWSSSYTQNISKTVQPEHYQNPIRVTKEQVEKPLLATTTGKFSTLRNTAGNVINHENPVLHNKGLQLYSKTLSSLKKEPTDVDHSHHQKTASCDLCQRAQTSNPDFEYVQSGTEHWKTTYVAGIKDPYAYAKATRPEWTLHKEPHQVESGPWASDYKTQFGDRGANPINKLNRTVMMPPVPKSQDDLKLGTTQTTFHVPGYTGHMPRSVIAPEKLDQAMGVHSRKTFIKQNITENYQTRIPGYSGHRTANCVNDRGNLRQYCFSTVGERFH
jgi:hypothetical protein